MAKVLGTDQMTYRTCIDSQCPDQVVAEDFDIQGVLGVYHEQSPTLAEDERGYYQNQKGIWCIWWHRPYRHWWIGHCNQRGQNHGHAWLKPDSLCPSEGKVGEWHRGGTDAELEGLVRLPRPEDDLDAEGF